VVIKADNLSSTLQFSRLDKIFILIMILQFCRGVNNNRVAVLMFAFMRAYLKWHILENGNCGFYHYVVNDGICTKSKVSNSHCIILFGDMKYRFCAPRAQTRVNNGLKISHIVYWFKLYRRGGCRACENVLQASRSWWNHLARDFLCETLFDGRKLVDTPEVVKDNSLYTSFMQWEWELYLVENFKSGAKCRIHNTNLNSSQAQYNIVCND